MGKTLKLATNYSIAATDYAGQGNAILGIRDSGKTYTGTKAAEELLDAGIPIIAFDPIGIWKNLKIGVGKHRGYPVVVAGGVGSDIILTVNNAVDIVKAAMKENISLVIDLYCTELANKSTWIRIVQDIVEYLMYHNKDYGIRHVFIEEAAEFIPQRLQPQHSKVYSSIERLARMGRNAHLGMTIINQRAEEVNKAILEIMALCLLHKQVGKNSLLSIKKWLEIRGAEKNVDTIINQLPSLKQGECFVISDEPPVKIKILPKNTFHPDPKKPVDPLVSKLAVNVDAFVTKMNKQLEKKATPIKPTKALAIEVPTVHVNRMIKVEEMNRELQIKNGQLGAEIKNLRKAILVYEERNTGLAQQLCKISERLTDSHGIKIQETRTDVQEKRTNVSNNEQSVQKSVHILSPKHQIVSSGNGTIGKCSREVLRFLTTYSDREFSKAQVAIATGYSPGSGGFNNALSELSQRKFILRISGTLQVDSSAIHDIIQCIGTTAHRQYDIETYKTNLGKCEREIYEVLLANPKKAFTKEELCQNTTTQYSSGSGGFNNSLSRLKTLELIIRSSGHIQLNPELLDI